MNETQRYIQRRLEASRRRFAWSDENAVDILAWQTRLRLELSSRLGLDRLEGCPLDPAFEGTTVTFASQPGYRAFGYYLEPESGEDKGPAIICVPGHGAGSDAIVGLTEEPYQAIFALECVRHGYRVLALEPMGFGHRKSDRVGPHGWSCDADAKAALMVGETLAGWRIWDTMRGVDLLQVLPGVDPNRIGIMGISGGGMIALWTAALDQRIRAAMVSGYFCTFHDSILSIDHCLDNFVPGILDLVEMPDFAGLIAPRALFVESGREDPIFPAGGFKKAVDRAVQIYSEMNAAEAFGWELFEGAHEFRGQAGFEFLKNAI